MMLSPINLLFSDPLKIKCLTIRCRFEFKNTANKSNKFMHNASSTHGGASRGLDIVLRVPYEQHQETCCSKFNEMCQSFFYVGTYFKLIRTL